jgi:hypothetical protein
MGKKIMELIIGMLVVSMLLPSITAATTGENKMGTPRTSDIGPVEPVVRYKNCYIEVSAYIHNDWPAVIKLPNMLKVAWKQSPDSHEVSFGFYSYFVFGNDALITVYDKKDGTILWQHEGIHDPSIAMVGFTGDYIPDADSYYLTHFIIEGTVRLLGIRIYDFPAP